MLDGPGMKVEPSIITPGGVSADPQTGGDKSHNTETSGREVSARE